MVVIKSVMSSQLTTCSSCESQRVVKNCSIHNGKQNHKCNTVVVSLSETRKTK